MAYSLPPWLQAADPAKFEAEGLRIGDEEAGRLAEQALQQQAGQRAQQELQLRQQQLEQEATAAANKYQAQQAYAKDIAAGMPAIDAFLKHAPLMGQGAGMGGAYRAKELSQPKPPPPGWQFVKADTATGQPASFQMPGKIALPRPPSPSKDELTQNQALGQLRGLLALPDQSEEVKSEIAALKAIIKKKWPESLAAPADKSKPTYRYNGATGKIEPIPQDANAG